jgi:tetratricopeptide (TPR) repeat protein
LRKLALIAVFANVLFFANSAFGLQAPSQDNPVMEIAAEGIALHKAGEYKKAIAVYEAGLKTHPKSGYLHYEAAYSYYRLADYGKVLYHADIVIDLNQDALLEAFSIKASAQDAMGDLQASITTFKDAIANFPNQYLLRFNLGVTLYRTGDVEGSEQSFIQAVELNPSHASSHFLLAYINEQRNKHVKAMLSYYFFLMLEPDTDRSQNALESLIQIHKNSVQKSDDQNTSITLDSDNIGTELGTIELAISLAAASHQLSPTLSEQARFIDGTETLFDILSESATVNENFWIEFYGNFFAKLNKEGHTLAFTHHIFQIRSQNSVQWLETEKAAFEAFVDWLEN